MPKIKPKTYIGLDTETTGIDFKHGARPFLVTTCNEEGENTFWEWDVDPYTRKVKTPRKDLIEIQKTLDAADHWVLQNGKFDYKGLVELYKDNGMTLKWNWDKVHDTLVSGHLLASNQPHDLTSMVLVYLGVNIQPYEDNIEVVCNEARRLARNKVFKEKYGELLIAKPGLACMPSAKEKAWKNDMWLPRAIAKLVIAAGELDQYLEDHPWWAVCSDYANPDSASVLPLFKQHEQLLKQRELWKIYLTRLKAIPVIADMEEHGLTYSLNRSAQLRKQYQKDCEKSLQTCIKLSKGKLDKLPKAGVSNALKSVLFDQFKLSSSKQTKKGNVSVDKFVIDEWLSTIPQEQPAYTFIKSLKGFRKRQTALGYQDAYKKYQTPCIVKGKSLKNYAVIYSSLNMTGTDTLRNSSENPNGQQISKQELEEEEGKGHSARYMFGPAPGREWWSFDYENIELRIPGYESGEEKMIELFEHPDEPPYFGSYHLLNASIIYPDLFWPLAETKGAFKDQHKSTYYQWTKNGGFAKQYGAQQNKVDTTFKVKGAYDLLSASMPKMEALNKYWIDFANENGYVLTLPDKTVDPLHGYPILSTRSSWGSISPTIPLNHHVQSTAMWCTMKAMIRCHEYLKTQPGYFMILQVHDEIVFEMPAKGKANLPIVIKLQKLMEQSGEDISIPLRVAYSYHPNNWGEEANV